MTIQHFSGGSPSARAKLNDIVDAITPLVNLRGNEGRIGVNRTAAGVTLSIDMDVTSSQLGPPDYVLTGTANFAGGSLPGGVYACKIPALVSTTLNLTGGTVSAGSMASALMGKFYFANAPELGWPVHYLLASTSGSWTVVSGQIIGVASDGVPVVLGEVMPAPWGTLTGAYTGGDNLTNFGKYTLDLVGGGTSSAYAWMEPGSGSPGPTGLTVATTGSTASGSCVEMPLGATTRPMQFAFNPSDGNLYFGSTPSFG